MEKIKKFIKENPFVVVAIGFIAVVIIITVIVTGSQKAETIPSEIVAPGKNQVERKDGAMTKEEDEVEEMEKQRKKAQEEAKKKKEEELEKERKKEKDDNSKKEESNIEENDSGEKVYEKGDYDSEKKEDRYDGSLSFPKAEDMTEDNFEKMALEFSLIRPLAPNKDNFEDIKERYKSVVSKELYHAKFYSDDINDYEKANKVVEIDKPLFKIIDGKPGDEFVTGAFQYNYFEINKDTDEYVNFDIGLTIVFKKIDGEYRIIKAYM